MRYSACLLYRTGTKLCEKCIIDLGLQERKVANIYRTRKSPYMDFAYKPFLGIVHNEVPSKILLEEFRRITLNIRRNCMSKAGKDKLCKKDAKQSNWNKHQD